MIPERITTERLVLRRFSRRDVDPLTEAVHASLPELRLWLPWAHSAYDREDANAFVRDSIAAWKEERAFDYAIRSQTDPDLHLGNISIWHVSKIGRSGEIGYWIRSDRTGGGIASEVTLRLLRLGFERLGLHKVNLRIAVGNRASERVAEKLGFSIDGVLRQELRVGGRWLDHTIYSMLVSEFQPPGGPSPSGSIG